MLDFDYPIHYAGLIESINWNIQLPSALKGFFDESGIAEECSPEKRGAQRRIVRMKGALVIDRGLPMISREKRFIGVYTKDFSKDGCGILSPIQWFPEEVVRLVLPTFWLKLRVNCCQKLGNNCFQIGLELLNRRDPDRAAFIHQGKFVRS